MAKDKGRGRAGAVGQKEAAELLAVRGLAYLAERPELLGRFLALSGVGPAELRAAAADPAFLGGVLDFLLGDEPTLLDFVESSGVDPFRVGAARRHLPGAPPEE